MQAIASKLQQSTANPGLLLLLVILIIASSQSFSQSARIVLEGEFDDWQNVSPLHADAAGDQNSGNIDFHNIWAANDEQFLFLRIEVGTEINLQDLNSIVLYLDTDNNNNTGIRVNGIGAELEWTFGSRSGRFVSNGITRSIGHAAVGLITLPTVTSDDFEISLNRAALPFGTPLFPVSDIRIALEDRTGGDIIPDAAGGLPFSFSNEALPPLSSIAIEKQHPNSIRFLSYNVLRDNLFESALEDEYTRILQAIQPDIIGFQEIYNHSTQDLKNLMESMLPLLPGQQWHVSRVQSDNFVASRYPVISSHGIAGNGSPEANGAFLLNLRPQFNSDLLLIVAHPPCCANNDGRQFEIDAIMAFVRDAKGQGGALSLAQDTPIMILGDMNLVGLNQQLRTFLTGEIINTGSHGSSFDPDWDGSHFTDLIPRVANLPMTFTWYNEGSSFSPGRLDFMIYSDSVIESLKQFVLFTPNLPPDTLSKYGLEAADAVSASDHLPVVGDFRLKNLTAISSSPSSIPTEFLLEQNYPNPFNPQTSIRYHLPEKSDVLLNIYNVLGEEIATLVNAFQNAGIYQVQWDGKMMNGQQARSGVYIYKLQTANFVQAKKLILLQ